MQNREAGDSYEQTGSSEILVLPQTVSLLFLIVGLLLL